jgi:hypothetical protein
MDTPLEIYQGQTALIEVQFLNDDGSEINLTGSTVHFTVKKALTDADAQAVVAAEVTSHHAATDGITRVTLSPATTRALEAGAYLWDAQLVTGAGAVYPSGVGSLVVLKPVRRGA